MSEESTTAQIAQLETTPPPEKRPRPRRPKVSVPAELHREQRVPIDIVEALTGDGKSKIYDGVAAGTFPAPERDGARCTRWRVGDVLDYLERRRAASSMTAPKQVPVPKDPRRAAEAILAQRGSVYAKRLIAALAERDAEATP